MCVCAHAYCFLCVRARIFFCVCARASLPVRPLTVTNSVLTPCSVRACVCAPAHSSVCVCARGYSLLDVRARIFACAPTQHFCDLLNLRWGENGHDFEEADGAAELEGVRVISRLGHESREHELDVLLQRLTNTDQMHAVYTCISSTFIAPRCTFSTRARAHTHTHLRARTHKCRLLHAVARRYLLTRYLRNVYAVSMVR